MDTPHPVPQRRKVVVIIGSIGSGKTTAVEGLAQLVPNSKALYEPVDEWRATGILDQFYADMPKLSGMFQMYAFSSRLLWLKRMLRANPTIDVIFQDAHIITDRDVFKVVLQSSGFINEAENNIYLRTFDNWQELIDIQLDQYFIYIETSPEKCMDNKNKRNRAEEKTKVSLSYLSSLHEEFDKVYEDLHHHGVKIAKVNGELNERAVVGQIGMWLKEWGIVPKDNDVNVATAMSTESIGNVEKGPCDQIENVVEIMEKMNLGQVPREMAAL
jgi:deoxyadenosine/deoxycytidine kinase